MQLSKCFEILGLKGNEGIQDVKKHYRQLLKESYPVTGEGDDTEARKIIEVFKQIAQHFGADPNDLDVSAPTQNGSAYISDTFIHMSNINQTLTALQQRIKNLDTKNEKLEKELRALWKKGANMSLEERVKEEFLQLIDSPDITFSEISMPFGDKSEITIKKESKNSQNAPLVAHVVFTYDEKESSDFRLRAEVGLSRGNHEDRICFYHKAVEDIFAAIPDVIITPNRSIPKWDFENQSILEKLLGRGLEFSLARDFCHKKNISLRSGEITERAIDWLAMLVSSIDPCEECDYTEEHNFNHKEPVGKVTLTPKIFPESIIISQIGAKSSYRIQIAGREIIVKHARWEELVKKAYQIGYNYNSVSILEKEESRLKGEIKEKESELELFDALFSDNLQMITAGVTNGDES